MGGDSGDVQAPGVVLDERQGVEPSTEHGVEAEEAGRDYALGLGDGKRPSDRTTTWCRVDARVVQDPPDGRVTDVVTESGQFTLDSAVTPSWVVRGRSQHE
ncbi:hypothetical protein AB0G02_18895 [Actinosynnema sp. NPDC023658]|uniref:hypothetical protein n=1 Tax=Actinosynnema sp. NPDC023658 TaxID=3155465 RepID=UPI0033D70350